MRIAGFFYIVSVAVGLWALGATPVSAQVRVFLDVPKAGFLPEEIIQDGGFVEEEAAGKEKGSSGTLKVEVLPGEILEVPVFIEDGEENVISYALRVLYSEKVLKILEIRGGTFEGFSDPPITNPATFESGQTDFTANNATFVSTPATFNVATITYEVIGQPGQKGKLSIRKTPRTDITLKSTFGRVRKVSFKRRIIVRVR